MPKAYAADLTTKALAVQVFRMFWMPAIRERMERDGRPDYPARREAWATFLDMEIRNGRIPEERGREWTTPDWIEGP